MAPRTTANSKAGTESTGHGRVDHVIPSRSIYKRRKFVDEFRAIAASADPFHIREVDEDTLYQVEMHLEDEEVEQALLTLEAIITEKAYIPSSILGQTYQCLIKISNAKKEVYSLRLMSRFLQITTRLNTLHAGSGFRAWWSYTNPETSLWSFLHQSWDMVLKNKEEGWMILNTIVDILMDDLVVQAGKAHQSMLALSLGVTERYLPLNIPQLFKFLSLLATCNDKSLERCTRSTLTIAQELLEQVSYLAEADCMDYKELASAVALWLEDLPSHQRLLILETMSAPKLRLWVCDELLSKMGVFTSKSKPYLEREASVTKLKMPWSCPPCPRQKRTGSKQFRICSLPLVVV
ncbi:hypothetical protein SeMB42_g04830 [Synchytrium endobioticum]|uniref:Uncharacterized protein n=1 Tax=Synchytrium endobioticum TaxID=286115 RepID=A0A507CVG2_9FUNG|nr:hypothetical protein SeMB42_g04830 [Synchytrium endobioticum]